MKDDGDGVDYDTLVHAAVVAGQDVKKQKMLSTIFETKARLSSQDLPFFRLTPSDLSSCNYSLCLCHFRSNLAIASESSAPAFGALTELLQVLESDILRALCFSNSTCDQSRRVLVISSSTGHPLRQLFAGIILFLLRPSATMTVENCLYHTLDVSNHSSKTLQG